MKNSIDTIGNRTRDLPACSAVPQPTVPMCATYIYIYIYIYMYIKYALLVFVTFPFLHAAVMFYVALGPTQCIADTLFLGLMRLGHEAVC